MTDSAITQSQNSGNSKILSSVFAAIVASYCMNYASLHGVDFKTLDVPSEIVKSALVGAFSGFFAALTPHNFVQSVTDAILFCRDAYKAWRKAANSE